MSAPSGYVLKGVYVEPDVWKQIAVLARQQGVPIYRIVNDELRALVRRKLPRAVRRAMESSTRKPSKLDGKPAVKRNC